MSLSNFILHLFGFHEFVMFLSSFQIRFHRPANFLLFDSQWRRLDRYWSGILNILLLEELKYVLRGYASVLYWEFLLSNIFYGKDENLCKKLLTLFVIAGLFKRCKFCVKFTLFFNKFKPKTRSDMFVVGFFFFYEEKTARNQLLRSVPNVNRE